KAQGSVGGTTLEKLVYQGGPVITAAQVLPIFWGTAWNDAALRASADTFRSDLAQLLAGPYMLGLAQYKNISPATVLSPHFDVSDAPSPLTRSTIDEYLAGLITSSQIQDFRQNGQLLYLVITSGIGLELARGGWPAGWHQTGILKSGERFHWGWISAASTAIASHEIIEACTDPEVNVAQSIGFQQPQNGIEVADICDEIP